MSKPIATLRRPCRFCGKIEQEISRKRIPGKRWLVMMECGHAKIVKDIETPIEDLPITAQDGKVAYEYQMRSIKFFELAGLNGICAHEMGVGKTTVATGIVKRNRKLVTPVLVCVKSGLRYQMFLDFVNWTGLIPQIITDGNQIPHPDYFPVTIVSYDMLRIFRPDVTREWQQKYQSGQKCAPIRWTDEMCVQFKFIILDECQMMKNSQASRTRAVKQIASAYSRVPGGIKPRILGLSGTPIKNDASEYAPILHLVNPTLFPSESGFLARDCRPIGGSRFALRWPDAFHEKTKNFIQRFTRAEVLPELPAISRMFRHAEMNGDLLEKYKEVIKEFQKFMGELEEVSVKNIQNILGFFSRMRRITGAAKVEAAQEFVEEFLLSTDRKLVVFFHHKDTGNMLYQALLKLSEDGGLDEPLLLVSEMNMEQRQDAINQFKGITQERVSDGETFRMREVPTGKNHRVLIASTQCAGEGLNMQFCSDCLIMERQWNPANEEQAEARFPRPGQKADKINATYLIAAGTIDEFLTELVEKKRSILHSTLDNVETHWVESSLMRELADMINTRGLSKWRF